MSRHDQVPKKRDMTCPACKKGDCGACVDILRSVYADDLICTCTRENHLGEPASQQIKDPFTGDVHGPAVVITKDGEVKVNEGFREHWRSQFDRNSDDK